MKTKLINISAAAAALIAVLASCDAYKIDSQPGADPTIVWGLEVAQIDKNAVNAEEEIFSVSANTPWQITVTTTAEDQSWCRVSPSSSAVAGVVAEVTMTFADNLGSEPREATVTLSAVEDGSIADQVVKIVQQPSLALTVSGSATSAVYPSDGGSEGLVISSNAPWSIAFADESSRTWISLDRTNGEAGETTVNVTTAENTAAIRQAVLVVTVTDEEQGLVRSEEFTVMQDGLRFEIPSTEIERAAAGFDPGQQTIEIDANVDWTPSTETDWITDLGVDSDGNLTFTVGESIYFFKNKGEITLTPAKGDPIVLTVAQNLREFHVWGKNYTDKTDLDVLTEDRFLETGLKVCGLDAFRIALPGDYKRGTFTWEFAEVSIATAFGIEGGIDYDVSHVPNIAVGLCDDASKFGGAQDFRLNGNGWWLTWNANGGNALNNGVTGVNNKVLRNNANVIRKIVITLAADYVSFYVYGEDYSTPLEYFENNPTTCADARWAYNGSNEAGFSYCLQFANEAATTADEYVVLKSFKAEPAE